MTTHIADTSVAIPLVLASHDAHALVNRVLGRRRLYLAAHAAVETYAVLTRLPGDARLAAADAVALIKDRFVGTVGPAGDPVDAVERLAAVGIAGGATYDGLVALAALSRTDATLYSRDRRATATYNRLRVSFELITA